MFLDGLQRKRSSEGKGSRSGSLSQHIQQHDPIQASKMLGAKVATKLSQLQPATIAGGLRDDLARSLSRLLVAESKSGGDSGGGGSKNKRPSAASAAFSQGRARATSIRLRSSDSPRAESCLTRSVSSASAVAPAAGSRRRANLSPHRLSGGTGKIAPADWAANELFGPARRKSTIRNSSSNSRLRELCESHRANEESAPTQSRWMVALKASLQRSLSARCAPGAGLKQPQQSAQARRQQFRFEKSTRAMGSNSVASGTENLVSQVSLNKASSCVRRLLNSRRSLRSVALVAGPPSKRCSLAAALLTVGSLVPVMLVLAGLLAARGQQHEDSRSLLFASAVPLGAEIRPIWLDDALLTLDPSQADTPAPASQLDDDDDADSIFARGQQASSEQPDEGGADSRSEPDDNDSSSEQLFGFVERRGGPRWQPQQPVLAAGAAGSDDDAASELLWIQRRRLERDRALEPPARLRKQPMRRAGYSPPIVAAETGAERETPEAGAGQDWLRAPRPVRGRQSRQSALAAGGDQALDEALRQILDEAHGSRSLIEELYDELELRSGGGGGSNSGAQQQQQRASLLGSAGQQQQSAALAQKAALMMSAGDLLAQREQRPQQAELGGATIGEQQQAGPEQLLAESMRAAPIGAAQDSSAESAPDESGGDLAVAGDDVVLSADSDDLGSARAVGVVAASPDWRPPTLNAANFAQQEPVDASAGGEGEAGPSEAPAAFVGDNNDNILSQQQRPQQAQGKLVELAGESGTGGARSVEPGSSGAGNPAAIGFSERQASSSAPIGALPGDSAPSGQRAAAASAVRAAHKQHQAPALDSFHVVEDIDQVADDSQEAAAGPLELADDAPVDASASAHGAGLEEQLQPPRGRWLEAGVGGGELLLGAPPSEMDGAQKRAARIGRLLAARDGLRPAEAQGAGTTADRPASPWMRSLAAAATAAKRGTMSLPAGGAANPPAALRRQSEEARNFKSAIQMIEAGYLSKGQLIGAATRLKSHIERTVKIPRGSILGLYPISSEQLLVKLDTSNLSADQMMDLVRNFDFARGFIVVSWPKESRHNPVPVLAAILRVLALTGDWPDGFQANSSETAALGSLVDASDAATDKYRITGGASDDDDGDDDDRDASGAALAAAAAITAARASAPTGDQAPGRGEHEQLGRLAALEAAATRAAPGGQLWSAPLGLAQYGPAGRKSDAGWSDSADEGAHQQQLALATRQVALERQRLDQQRAAAAAMSLAPTSGARSGRLSLALLSAYLNSIYRSEPRKSAGWPFDTRSLDAGRLAELLAGTGSLVRADQSPLASRLTSAAAADDADNDNDSAAGARGRFSWLELLRPLALLAAACVALLVAKLLTGGSGKPGKPGRLGRFGAGARGLPRSLLSSSTESQTLAGEAAAAKQAPDLESAACSASGQRRFSCDSASGQSEATASAYDSNLTLLAKANHRAKNLSLNFDLLSSKLHSLLGRQGERRQPSDCSATPDDQQQQRQRPGKHEPSTAAPSSAEDGEAPPDSKQASEDGASEAGSFRSSRSYIKSLIDALAKAGSQIPSAGRSLVSQYSCSADEFEQSAAFLAAKSKSAQQQPADSSDDDQPGIIVSQMDISAAHLILAYMEKHLEDKERLRREWLELNNSSGGLSGGPGGGAARGADRGANSAGQQTAASAKINQLMLQRLAKVANSDENRHKNRNCLVVPFDRNRVKLIGPQMLAPAPSDRPCAGSGEGAPLGSVRERGRALESKASAPTASSDYINASYICDDDPRRPTHIIAQGPSEQTVGQFWQMVWEQGISVIVMLTRLNENSIRMCHCYWPTNTAGSAGAESTTAAQDAPGAASSGAAAGSNGASHSKATALIAAAPAATTSSASNECTSGSPPTAANGRRGSVTSVFNAPSAARLVGAGLTAAAANQPIVANGDLTNNVLYFDAYLASGSSSSSIASLDEEPSPSASSSAHASSKSSPKPKLTTGAGSPRQVKVPVKFEVHLVSEHVSSKDFLVRNMYMINRSTGETRTITQFHYLAWPEAGVPENVRSLLQFRRKVHQSYRNLKSPILVHCSDGAGRSGTYTLIDIILERIKKGAKEIDPRATLEHLRDQRIGLCATQSQFQFVLMALAEEIQIILNALPQ